MEDLYCEECARTLEESETHTDAEELTIGIDLKDGEVEVDGQVYLLCDYCDSRVAEGYYNNKDYFDLNISAEIEDIDLSGDIIKINYYIGDGYNFAINDHMEMTLDDCGMMAMHAPPEEEEPTPPIDLVGELETLLDEMTSLPYFSIRAKVMGLSERLKAQRDSESA